MSVCGKTNSGFVLFWCVFMGTIYYRSDDGYILRYF